MIVFITIVTEPPLAKDTEKTAVSHSDASPATEPTEEAAYRAADLLYREEDA
jgi:hypothetical protein